MFTCQVHTPFMHSFTRTHVHTQVRTHAHTHTHTRNFHQVQQHTNRVQSSFLRSSMCCCAILAYSIAEMSTSQVRGWRPCPPLHLVRPACTAPSSSRGWLVKQVSIVSVGSPTPSRTALPFVAAFLLTYFLKSIDGLDGLQRRHNTSQHIPHK